MLFRSWEDMELWDRVDTYGPDIIDPLLLIDLAKSVQSVQLPVYLHLFTKCEKGTPYDAGLIKLAEDGKTEKLFGPKWTNEERTEAVDEMTPKLIKVLVRHMLDTSQFTPQPGTRCKWCDFKTPCGQ